MTLYYHACLRYLKIYFVNDTAFFPIYNIYIYIYERSNILKFGTKVTRNSKHVTF